MEKEPLPRDDYGSCAREALQVIFGHARALPLAAHSFSGLSENERFVQEVLTG